LESGFCANVAAYEFVSLIESQYVEENMISVLMYHQIAQMPKARDPEGFSVLPQVFEQQMAYLHRAGYRCLSLNKAVRYWQEGLSQPKKSFVLTFDDGYRDLHSTVWPILDRFGFTATIFLVAGRVGNCSNWDGQNDSLAAPLLSWAEIRELAQAGFTFGNHTVTHPQLPLLDDKQARQEIQQAKVMIEDKLGVEVDLFCYPYTLSDARIQRLVAESGHIAACGGSRSHWGLFNIWRAECFGKDSSFSVALKAGGWYQKYIWLREQSTLGRPLVQMLKHLRGRIRDNQTPSVISTN
jgi:peptidoglycan/xylan/chitin deacetylase (PgdA/CDA1 family)